MDDIKSIESEPTSIAGGIAGTADYAELVAWQRREVAEFWGKLDHWKIDEAVVLVLGGNPRHAGIDSLVNVVSSKVADLRELVMRAHDCGHFLYDRSDIVPPSVFIAWAARKGYPAPADLVRVVEAQGKPIMDARGMLDVLKAGLDAATQQRDELQAQNSELVKKANQEISQGNDAIAKYQAEHDSLRREIAQLQSRPAKLEANKWPWGGHETELLRKMAAAANRLWKTSDEGGLYDPTDPTTAPTNEQVEKLLEQDGVAKRVREVMAQILRADGLRTGPRK